MPLTILTGLGRMSTPEKWGLLSFLAALTLAFTRQIFADLFAIVVPITISTFQTLGINPLPMVFIVAAAVIARRWLFVGNFLAGIRRGLACRVASPLRRTYGGFANGFRTVPND
jgi:hypothetical protein